MKTLPSVTRKNSMSLHRITRRLGAIAASVAVASATVVVSASAASASALTVNPAIINVEGNDFELAAASPAGNFVAFSGYSSSTLTIIDTATNTATDVSYGDFTAFGNPGGVAFSADGSTLYMADYETDVLYIIDTATAAVTSTITDEAFVGIWTLAITPDGSTAVIGNYTSDDAVFVDLETETVTSANFDTVANVYSEYISADGTQVYFVDYDGSVDIFDIASGEIAGGWLAAEGLTGSYYSSCVSPDGLTLFLPDNNGIHFAAVSLVDGSLIAMNTTDMVESPYSCMVSPDGQSVFLTDYDVADPAQFTEFSTADMAVVASHDIAGLNYSQTVAFADCRAFVSGYNGGVAVVEGFTACEVAAEAEQPELAETGFTSVALAGLALASLITAAGVFALKRRTV